MNRVLFALGALAVLALTACGTTPPANVADAKAQIDAAMPQAFKYGCAAVAYANGAFQAAAPGLVASGKMTAEMMSQEKTIMASSEAICANPPADAATAGLALLGQASAIYLMMAPPPSS